MLNRFQFIGRLTKDPEIIYFGPDQHKMARFTIAVNRPNRKADASPNTQEADFIQLAAFNKLADLCEEFLAKGKLILAEGSVRSSSKRDEAGNYRYYTSFTLRSIEFLSPRERPEDAEAELPDLSVLSPLLTTKSGETMEEDDIPF